MKRKKLLALTLAGAMLAMSLTACTPLDVAAAIDDWFFGGGSSGSVSTTGMTAEEKAVAEAAAAEMKEQFGCPVMAQDIPEMQQIKTFFKPEWANGKDKMMDIGQDGRSQAARILSAYAPNKYYVQLRVIDVTGSMSVRAEAQAFHTSENLYYCDLIPAPVPSPGKFYENVAATVTVTTVKSGEKTYRLLLLLIEYGTRT